MPASPMSVLPSRFPLAAVFVLFALIACSSNGAMENGGGDDDEDNTAPPTPANVTAQSQDQGARVEWDAVDASDLDGYVVYRGTTSGFSVENGTRASGGVLSATVFEDTGLTNGTTYFYKVTAIDLAGLESDGSSAVEVTPLAPPETPANVVADSGDETVTLSWDAAASGPPVVYIVYRSTAAGFEPGATTQITDPGLDATTFQDTGLTNGEEYYYRVVAVNDNGQQSPPSAEVEASPIADPPGRP